ncbi:hypothetical protein IQ276_004995 [Desmonostoc muscorum LEGE 12446]|uniref:hypothetical protein n=1 Tax=Desmonostoc muscorum TaxID=1179 RepID=UPI001F484EAE|nr:hypothetical protein [Desmonostoc muscorum]MCF2145826.1 hypothetical protein [Desmonostoc muscorum LEGE 12446]
MKKHLLAIGVTSALSTIAFCGVANGRIISNGISINGVSINGSSINGFTLQRTQLQSLKVEGGQLVAVKRVEAK